MVEDIKRRLLGHTITGFDITPDRYQIEFRLLNEKPVRCRTEGDCCSRSWIESIDDPAALLGVVQDVEEIDMPDLGQLATPFCEHPDVVQYYGLKITTDKGRAVIDYRNDSNGYYGGEIVLAN